MPRTPKYFASGCACSRSISEFGVGSGFETRSTQTIFLLMAWVYILRGSCGRHYIGSTENFDRRLGEHRRGKVHSTRRFGQPLEVVVTRQVTDIVAARSLERKLKSKKNPRLAINVLSRQ